MRRAWQWCLTELASEVSTAQRNARAGCAPLALSKSQLSARLGACFQGRGKAVVSLPPQPGGRKFLGPDLRLLGPAGSPSHHTCEPSSGDHCSLESANFPGVSSQTSFPISCSLGGAGAPEQPGLA